MEQSGKQAYEAPTLEKEQLLQEVTEGSGAVVIS
jgi:hypothetical protein